MIIDYSDTSERRHLLVAIKVAINDIISDQVRQAKEEEGEILEGSALVHATGEILDYLDDKLTIKFND